MSSRGAVVQRSPAVLVTVRSALQQAVLHVSEVTDPSSLRKACCKCLV
eukprot:CAMPEP_0194549070 /NCGR_PEP_ID=MMETSP0253-20130528/94651_1 /TAXON_ID=2966 /ORGANISM="Noctiluca scintillans" /LENGTH=47 /DNA_ID= /DNA_START= /DNA_END= /DNA_ORIENTATION=